MSDAITTQTEALLLWPEEGEDLMWGWRGESWVMIGHRSVTKRVWERLLERGDLVMEEVERGPKRRRYRRLSLTDQGRQRRDSL